jgi:hypothetical protein
MTEQVPVTKDSLEFSVSAGAYPLKKFDGRVTDYNPVPRNGMGGAYTVVEFDFAEVKVRPGGSDSPYNMETGKIGVTWKQDPRPSDPWHHFSQSYKDIMGETARVSSVVGKMIGITQELKTARRPRPVLNADGGQMMQADGFTKVQDEWIDVQLPFYVIDKVDGKTASGAPGMDSNAPAIESFADPMDLFISIADGKSAPDFNQAAMTDVRVKDNSQAWTTIIAGGDTLLTQLVSQGKLTVDEGGLHHKV